MSHEFPKEDLDACTCCGKELPQDMLIYLEDGQVLCEDCYEEYQVSFYEGEK